MKALILGLLFIFSACNDKTVETIRINQQSSVYAKEINDLISENEKLQKDLNHTIIFQSSNNDQRNNFRDFLIRTRRELIKLLANPKDSKALGQLEKLVGQYDSMIVEIQDESFIAPFVNDAKSLIENLYIVQGRKPIAYAAQFTFGEDSLDKIIKIKEENAAEFQARKNDNGEYLGVDSFKPKNHGESVIISPAFELEDLNYEISLSYLVRFYSDEARAENLIQFYIGEERENINEIDWKLLKNQIGPDAGSFGDPFSTTQYELVDFKDTKVRVKIRYFSDKDKGYFPAFNISGVTIRERR